MGMSTTSRSLLLAQSSQRFPERRVRISVGQDRKNVGQRLVGTHMTQSRTVERRDRRRPAERLDAVQQNGMALCTKIFDGLGGIEQDEIEVWILVRVETDRAH